MRIDEILARAQEPVFSFEFFPPKTDDGERVLGIALESLRQLDPDFVSVTYGALGSARTRTLELTKWIKQELGIEAMAHLSCVGCSRDELRKILDDMSAAGIENVLALRGDPPRGETDYEPHPDGLRYSTELASLISADYDVCVGGACFPEVHPEAPDLAHDLRFLKEKIDRGVSFLITQLFFDSRALLPLRRGGARGRDRGPDHPRGDADHRPAPDQDDHRHVRRHDPTGAARGARMAVGMTQTPCAQLGVSYATLQCAELLARGAPGIHFYTLNRSPATRAILSALKLLRPWVRREIVNLAV